MEVTARAKFVRRTPRKARLLADAVRGMGIAEALAYLEFSAKHAAKDVAKVINSAAANAEHNFSLNRDDLYLKNLLVDEGPTMKRIRQVSRGMAHQYFHRTCHITAVVEEKEAPAPRRRAAAPRRPARAQEPRRTEAAAAAEPEGDE